MLIVLLIIWVVVIPASVIGVTTLCAWQRLRSPAPVAGGGSRRVVAPR